MIFLNKFVTFDSSKTAIELKEALGLRVRLKGVYSEICGALASEGCHVRKAFSIIRAAVVAWKYVSI